MTQQLAIDTAWSVGLDPEWIAVEGMNDEGFFMFVSANANLEKSERLIDQETGSMVREWHTWEEHGVARTDQLIMRAWGEKYHE